MKLKCTNCGKRFDYDLYAGLCPHCGTYMRPASMSASGTNREQNDQTTTAHRKEPSSRFPGQTVARPKQSAGPDTVPKAQKKNAPSLTQRFRNSRIVTCLLLFLLVLAVAVPYGFSSYTFQTKKKELTLTEPSNCQKITGKTPVTIPTENGDFKVSMISVTPDNDKTFETPDGYEILAVQYHVDIPSEVLEIYSGQAEENYLYTNWQYGTVRAYGVTKSGSYIKPVSEFDLTNVKNLDEKTRQKLGIGDSIEAQNGSLYYLVKKNDFKGILINQTDPYTDALTHSYLITGIKRKK